MKSDPRRALFDAQLKTQDLLVQQALDSRRRFTAEAERALSEYCSCFGITTDDWYIAWDRVLDERWRLLTPDDLGCFPHSHPDAYAQHGIWLMTLPHASPTRPGLVDYYRTPEKLIAGRETSSRLGRYLKSVMNLTLPVDSLVSRYLARACPSQINFIENDDYQGWIGVYASPSIKSCMTNEPAVQCYATAAFGLPDNGLRLAYLGARDRAVARCIVNDSNNTYIKVYGDDRLKYLLDDAGYTEASDLSGVRLATYDTEQGWAAPYVDGDVNTARLEDADSIKPSFVIDPAGNWFVSNQDGTAVESEHCERCGDPYDIHQSVRVYRIRGGHLNDGHEWCPACHEMQSETAEIYGDYFPVALEDCIFAGGRTFVNIKENLNYYGVHWNADVKDYEVTE